MHIKATFQNVLSEENFIQNIVHVTYTIVKFSSKDVLECSLGIIFTKSLDTLADYFDLILLNHKYQIKLIRISNVSKNLSIYTINAWFVFNRSYIKIRHCFYVLVRIRSFTS